MRNICWGQMFQVRDFTTPRDCCVKKCDCIKSRYHALPVNRRNPSFGVTVYCHTAIHTDVVKLHASSQKRISLLILKDAFYYRLLLFIQYFQLKGSCVLDIENHEIPCFFITFTIKAMLQWT